MTYQVTENELRAIQSLGVHMGLAFRGVANLWIPVLLGALSHLRPGGAMAFVVPAEIFTGLSAGDARTWLTSNFSNLRIDLFEPGSFPDVLQEIVIISGRRSEVTGVDQSGYTNVRFVEHWSTQSEREWSHYVPKGPKNWTQYLLAPEHLEALALARSLPSIQLFGDVAKLDVSTVTGANDFFSVTNAEMEKYQLDAWADPLLPRIRHAKELVYTSVDHEETAASGAKAWLLNFSAAISVKGMEAQIKDGVWVCEDPVLEGRLNSMSPPFGYYPYQFWRDLRAAECAEEELRVMVRWCVIPPKDDYQCPQNAVFD